MKMKVVIGKLDKIARDEVLDKLLDNCVEREECKIDCSVRRDCKDNEVSISYRVRMMISKRNWMK